MWKSLNEIELIKDFVICSIHILKTLEKIFPCVTFVTLVKYLQTYLCTKYFCVMTHIKILGTGCQKCKTLTNLVKNIVAENNIDATIEKVQDIQEIMKFSVLTTPALVINNVVALKGSIPSKEEILAFLK